jgi:hypothetical protein
LKFVLREGDDEKCAERDERHEDEKGKSQELSVKTISFPDHRS